MANPIQKVLRLPKVDFYETHLALVNAVIPSSARLTAMELKVLAIFMSFEEEIPLGRFGTYARKLVKEKLEISDGGLGNYIKFLKSKRFILEVDGKLDFVPLIKIPDTEQVYTFKLINTDHDN